MEISTFVMISFCAVVIILVLLAIYIELFSPDEAALWPEEGQDTESIKFVEEMNKENGNGY